MSIESLIAKIRSLSPSALRQVEDFVDFLVAREEDRAVSRAASRLSEGSFRQIWDNPEDAEYDRM